MTDRNDTAARGESPSSAQGERLQKVLASAGVASRRVCEQYIVAGRVRVNGRVVTELGTRIHPQTDQVEVDGTPVQLDTAKRYLMLNKPRGVVSSMSDEGGRPDLARYAEQAGERVYNVGRLDAETTGLLVLTNDGELAHVLAHPSFGVEKTYLATVRGVVKAETLRRLRQGVELDDGLIVADRARVVGEPSGGRTIVEITLHSGRNRIVRRMLAAVGHPVIELVRRQFGPLRLGSLGVGRMRELTKVEVGALLSLVRDADASRQDPDD
jgi:23S rRNA pseudouridine2605 synthase/16S rRNA pseudouridine516 synthase